MDDGQVGAVVRQVRLRLGISQQELAFRAGVAQSTVSQLERGNVERVSLPVARRICRALEIGLPLAPRWRGADLYRLLDARHARLVNLAMEALVAAGWQAEPEFTFNHYGDRGSVDVLGWHPDYQALVIQEIKTTIVDVQDTIAALNRKSRVVPQLVAEERAWNVSYVGVVLVVPDAHGVRNAIARHSAIFDASLPARTTAVRRWLARPSGGLRGILFVPDIDHSNGRQRPGRPKGH